jgi:hypothetical protein
MPTQVALARRMKRRPKIVIVNQEMTFAARQPIMPPVRKNIFLPSDL